MLALGAYGVISVVSHLVGPQMAEKLGVPTFVGAMVKQMWGYAMSRGHAKEDLSTIVRSVEEWAGVEVRGKAAG